MIRQLTRAFVVLLVAAGARTHLTASPSEVNATSGGAAAAREHEPAPPKCCFTNPGYAGTCEVEPAKDESCRQILDYLNNPMSQGKGYCGNTQIRGGWEIAACEPKK